MHAGVLDRGRFRSSGVNILLSGDNAVVIALACRSLPPKQRFWGILLGAGVAVLLRIFFTLIIAQTMGSRSSSWSAACCCCGSRSSYRAERGARRRAASRPATRCARGLARDRRRHRHEPRQRHRDRGGGRDRGDAGRRRPCADIKTTLIVFGLATSVPLIIAGSALLMKVMETFPILVWAGGALLGWVAGEIIVKDAAVAISYMGQEWRRQGPPWAAGSARSSWWRLGWRSGATEAQDAAGAAADRRSAGTGGVPAAGALTRGARPASRQKC